MKNKKPHKHPDLDLAIKPLQPHHPHPHKPYGPVTGGYNPILPTVQNDAYTYLEQLNILKHKLNEVIRFLNDKEEELEQEDGATGEGESNDPDSEGSTGGTGGSTGDGSTGEGNDTDPDSEGDTGNPESTLTGASLTISGDGTSEKTSISSDTVVDLEIAQLIDSLQLTGKISTDKVMVEAVVGELNNIILEVTGMRVSYADLDDNLKLLVSTGGQEGSTDLDTPSTGGTTGSNGSDGSTGGTGGTGSDGSTGGTGSDGSDGSDGSAYTLPVATAETLGGVKSSSSISVASDGTMSINLSYEYVDPETGETVTGSAFPIASKETLGIVRIGSGIEISEDGTISVFKDENNFTDSEIQYIADNMPVIPWNTEGSSSSYEYNTVYVDPSKGSDDTGNGLIASPYKTIPRAMNSRTNRYLKIVLIFTANSYGNINDAPSQEINGEGFEKIELVLDLPGVNKTWTGLYASNCKDLTISALKDEEEETDYFNNFTITNLTLRNSAIRFTDKVNLISNFDTYASTIYSLCTRSSIYSWYCESTNMYLSSADLSSSEYQKVNKLSANNSILQSLELTYECFINQCTMLYSNIPYCGTSGSSFTITNSKLYENIYKDGGIVISGCYIQGDGNVVTIDAIGQLENSTIKGNTVNITSYHGTNNTLYYQYGIFNCVFEQTGITSTLNISKCKVENISVNYLPNITFNTCDVSGFDYNGSTSSYGSITASNTTFNNCSIEYYTTEFTASSCEFHNCFLDVYKFEHTSCNYEDCTLNFVYMDTSTFESCNFRLSKLLYRSTSSTQTFTSCSFSSCNLHQSINNTITYTSCTFYGGTYSVHVANTSTVFYTTKMYGVKITGGNEISVYLESDTSNSATGRLTLENCDIQCYILYCSGAYLLRCNVLCYTVNTSSGQTYSTSQAAYFGWCNLNVLYRFTNSTTGISAYLYYSTINFSNREFANGPLNFSYCTVNGGLQTSFTYALTISNTRINGVSNATAANFA